MSQLATYKNKYTGEIAEYLRCETVPNYPNPITVHVLLFNGKEVRSDDDLFFRSWSHALTDRTSDDNPQ